jgi:type IV secretion system protein VirB6
MSVCDQLSANASAGAAPALRAVDCLANETAAAAFGRLFAGGSQGGGVLLPALTIILTLYIAFFAISLLTGRSRLGLSALTPRMMTLGLVLTFATSWAAYQGVVWNLATGAPDQIAGVLMGAKGSATGLFADRIDMVFAAIAEVSASVANTAQPAGEGGAQGVAQAAASGSFTPGNLMWLSALLLLLGTVGVLVTARIALAVLLAVGPIFVVFALFSGTRGLFAGWVRGVVMTAVTPLFVVLGGVFMLELVVPVVSELRGVDGANGGIDGRASMALFLIAAVHVALMAMMLKVSGTMVSAWTIFGLAPRHGRDKDDAAPEFQPLAASGNVPAMAAGAAAPYSATRRAALIPAAFEAAAQADGMAQTGGAQRVYSSRTVVSSLPDSPAGLPSLPARRARGIGSRFASRPNSTREMIR